jgi:uncharacterized protein YxjI
LNCPSCGKPVEQDAKFCMSCGANLESTEAPQTTPPPSGIPMGASPLSGNEFIIEQKIAAMRDTYGIKDRNGNLLAYVKRKIVSVGPQFWFETPNETRFGEMRGKVLTVRPTFEIYDNQGLVGAVKKKVLKLLGSEWWLEDPSGNEIARIKGNITAHDFTIKSPSGSDIAQIHKKWKTIRDAYGIEIVGQELTPYIVIAYVIAMDHAEYKGGKGFGFGAGGIRFGT